MSLRLNFKCNALKIIHFKYEMKITDILEHISIYNVEKFINSVSLII